VESSLIIEHSPSAAKIVLLTHNPKPKNERKQKDPIDNANNVSKSKKNSKKMVSETEVLDSDSDCREDNEIKAHPLVYTAVTGLKNAILMGKKIGKYNGAGSLKSAMEIDQVQTTDETAIVRNINHQSDFMHDKEPN
jgi:hypothetical protein